MYRDRRVPGNVFMDTGSDEMKERKTGKMDV